VSIGLGMALAARVQGRDYRVFVGTSDGESQEGQVWEMASAAVHHRADNLTLLLDYNGIQIDGFTKDVMDTGDLHGRFEAFGWHVQSVDGHDMPAIHDALLAVREVTGKPQMILCKTVLGRPVSFMENVAGWHGVVPNDEQLATALAELQKGG
jgi:transketolase